jgi:protein-disulfide isomerase
VRIGSACRPGGTTIERNDQLAQLLFNDPNSPRTGAKEPKLTIVSFTDYNCPYCKQFDPMLEKIVHDNPDVQLIVKLLPFKGKVR